jgi:hypothetical protein
MSDQITSFDPNIPKEEVDRLFRKLADTRLPQIPVVPDAGDDYGTLLTLFHCSNVNICQAPP